MSIDQMRDKLSKLYGPSWAEKVRKMSDKQVAAIYNKKLANKEIK